MSPALLGYPRSVVEKVFLEYGIHLLQKFSDGQTRWGNLPPSTPYKGKSLMVQAARGFGLAGLVGDSYDIFTIRAVLSKLGPAAKSQEVEERIAAVALEESERE